MADPQILAFDMYGTLVDPIRIWRSMEQHMGQAALRIAEVWRAKQLEYTFRLTAMQQYEDFEQVTRKSLDYALAASGVELAEDVRRALLAEYDSLEPFPEVAEGLQRLRSAGHPLVVFSNGTPRMLQAVVGAAGLEGAFQALISVHDVRAYKPSPRVYQHAARYLGRPLSQVRLVSSNPFDVLGAAAAGMQVAWLNRSGAVFDTLGPPPDLVITRLTELAGRV
jgi:2-haloacid dehalogenase